jgi:hypothetical protein
MKVKIAAGSMTASIGSPQRRFDSCWAYLAAQRAHERLALGVAATNNVAQYRIGERRCQRLAVGEQRGFGQNGFEARQAISLVHPVDVAGGLSHRQRPDQNRS